MVWFCGECGAPCDTTADRGEPPVCAEHGPRWEAIRNAPCASVIIQRPDGRVLLGRRAIDPWRGWWEIQGGFCDYGEHPAATARREAIEEVRLEVELVEWRGDYLHPVPGDDVWRMVTVYLGRPTDPDAEPSVDGREVVEAEWFALDALPEQVVPGHLARLVDLASGNDPLEVGREAAP